jgi:hypothetical protein
MVKRSVRDTDPEGDIAMSEQAASMPPTPPPPPAASCGVPLFPPIRAVGTWCRLRRTMQHRRRWLAAALTGTAATLASAMPHVPVH